MSRRPFPFQSINPYNKTTTTAKNKNEKKESQKNTHIYIKCMPVWCQKELKEKKLRKKKEITQKLSRCCPPLEI